MSAAVEETGDAQGRRIVSRYWMDVCPDVDGMLSLVRRDLELATINGVVPSDLVKKAQAADAGLPLMTVDHDGAFVKEDPSNAWRLADLWHGWVEVWLHVDPKRGNPQEISVQNVGDGTRILVSYRALTGDHHARFEARRELDKDEVWQMTKDEMLRAGISDVQVLKMTRGAEEKMEVETDWPEVRPWFAHSRRTVHFAEGFNERELVEDRQYRFDWHADAGDRPKCPEPRKTTESVLRADPRRRAK
jgi:hypothetical protein